MVLNFLILSILVGIVTAFVNVKYDRFFILLLIIFLFGNNIDAGIEILLWIIFFGSAMFLTENFDKIKEMPNKMKKKFFVIIPLLTLVPSFIGAYLFDISSNKILLIILSIITLLYALRMIFIHFKPEEMDYPMPGNKYQKFCGIFGPIISGLSIGFMGTSLKSLKIPFAIKIGKLNMKQVYLGNAFTAFFAAGFSLIWHNIIFIKQDMNIYFEKYFLMAAALWAVIHFIVKITSVFVKPHWMKSAQIIVGIVLLVAFSKLLMLI